MRQERWAIRRTWPDSLWLKAIRLMGLVGLVAILVGLRDEARDVGVAQDNGAVLHLPYLARNPGVVPAHDFVAMVGGPSWTVATLGEHVLVGDGPHIVTLDVSDPANPREIGRSAALPGLPLGLAVDESRSLAVVALSPGAVATLDLRDPTQVALLDTFEFVAPADVRDVALEADVALLALGPAGIGTMDVSAPERIRLLATLETGSAIWHVAMDGEMAIALPVASRSSIEAEPVVVGLADPERPVMISRLASAPNPSTGRRGSSTSDVVLHGNYAFVANCLDRESPCLDAFDLSRADEPRRVGQYDTGRTYWLASDESRQLLFALNESGTLRSMRHSGSMLTPMGNVTVTNELGPMATSESRLFVAGSLQSLAQDWDYLGIEQPWQTWKTSGAALQVIDTSDGKELQVAGRRDQSTDSILSMTSIKDTVLLLIQSRPRLLSDRKTVWAVDPRAPARRDIVWPLNGSDSMLADGESLYTARRVRDGIRVQRWDASDPQQPVPGAVLTMPDPVERPPYPFWSLDAPLLAVDDGGIWMVATDAYFNRPATSSVLYAIKEPEAGSLEATSMFTLPFGTREMLALGENLVIRDYPDLFILDAAAAREGRLEVRSRTTVPREIYGRMAVWQDRLILAFEDVGIFAIEDGQPMEIVRSAFESPIPKISWSTVSAIVRDDVIHLAGHGGLRSAHLSEEKIEFLTQTHEIAAMERFHRREWVHESDWFYYVGIAAVGDGIVSERRQFWAYDAPYSSNGLAIWRMPGGLRPP